MKRSFNELNKAIHDVNFQCTDAFKRCKESAPLGYKFSTNLKSTEQERINSHINNGSIILPFAYDMFGDRLDGYVSVYIKI